MNEDRKMVISAKGYTEAVKQTQDLSHHIKAVYYNQCIADEYKSYWVLSGHMKRKIEIREHFKNKCWHQKGFRMFASEYCCVDCGAKMSRSNNESQYFTC